MIKIYCITLFFLYIIMYTEGSVLATYLVRRINGGGHKPSS